METDNELPVIDTAEVENQEVTTTAFPAELEFNAKFQNWTDERRTEEAKSYWEANPDKMPKPDAAAETASEETAPAAEAGETTPGETAVATPGFDPSVYEDEDVKSLDDVKARLKNEKALRADQEKISAAFEEFQKDKDVLSRAKNPVHPKIQKVNNFMHVTGIEDFKVAQEVVSLTIDEAKSNPLKAMTAAAILNNPALAGLEGGYDAVYRQICRKNGVDPLTPYADLEPEVKETVAFEATEAIKTLSEKQKEYETGPDDFFQSITKDNETQREQVNKNLEAWKPRMDKLASGLKEGLSFSIKTKEYGEINVSVAVSEDDVNNVLSSFNGFTSKNAPDEKAAQQLSSAVGRSLTSLDVITKVVEQAIAHDRKENMARIAKETIQKNHNGGPEVIDKSKGAPAKGPYDDFNARGSRRKTQTA